jgi:hypothetical protein
MEATDPNNNIEILNKLTKHPVFHKHGANPPISPQFGVNLTTTDKDGLLFVWSHETKELRVLDLQQFQNNENVPYQVLILGRIFLH